MNHEIAMQWADALESGKYTQTRGHLRDALGMCCLGVLCDLHAAATGNDDWHKDDKGEWFYDGGHAVPPIKVELWSGGKIHRPVYDGLVSLAERNDAGETFARIAAIIRRDWEML